MNSTNNSIALTKRTFNATPDTIKTIKEYMFTKIDSHRLCGFSSLGLLTSTFAMGASSNDCSWFLKSISSRICSKVFARILYFIASDESLSFQASQFPQTLFAIDNRHNYTANRIQSRIKLDFCFHMNHPSYPSVYIIFKSPRISKCTG